MVVIFIWDGSKVMFFESTDYFWMASYTINIIMLVLICTYIVRTENKKVVVSATSVITYSFGAI